MDFVHAGLAFEARKDADLFAIAVQARPMGRHGGWASQRGSLLDKAAEVTIAAALNAGGPKERSLAIGEDL